jgi:hypothetical protein
MDGKREGEVGSWALLNVAWAQEQSHFTPCPKILRPAALSHFCQAFRPEHQPSILKHWVACRPSILPVARVTRQSKVQARIAVNLGPGFERGFLDLRRHALVG